MGSSENEFRKVGLIHFSGIYYFTNRTTNFYCEIIFMNEVKVGKTFTNEYIFVQIFPRLFIFSSIVKNLN